MTTPTNDPFTVPANEPVPADPTSTDESADTVDTAPEEDPYAYVRGPDGKVRAVLKSDINDAPATETQNIPAATMVELPEQHFYVHLADGSVVRVKERDLPSTGGTNAIYGHWQREDKVYLVIGIYPVEDIVKGN